MNGWYLAAVAVLCNVSAQVAMKQAGPLAWPAPAWSALAWLGAAVTAYGLSFALTVRVLALFPLSSAAPAMAGSSFVLVTLAGAGFFGEALPPLRLAGVALIVLGVVLVARS